MPRPVPEQELDIVLKFGGGLHTRAGEEAVGDTECVAGKNFRLDLENNEFRRREAFDLCGTTPNGIGICNAWGDLIVRDPQLDLFDVIQKCTDLLLNGFRERRKTQREN